LVVFADVPPEDGETDEQRQERENTNAARVFDDNKSLPPLLQVPVNNRITPDRSTTTSGNKHLQHLRLLSSDAMMIHLVPTAYVQETSLGTLNAMALKSTTCRKPTWVPLLPP
jgi:hypothetical protein